MADETQGKPATVITKMTRLAVDYEEFMNHLRAYTLQKMEAPAEGYERSVMFEVPPQLDGPNKVVLLNVYDHLPEGHQLMLGPGEKAS